MSFSKRFLAAFSILSALCAVYSGPAAADPIEKVLTLSVGPLDPYLKDVPKLSLSMGPLAEDEKTIGVAFDKNAFAKLFTTKTIEKGEGFYRQATNFRDAQAEFKIKHVGGTVSTKTFSLAPDAPAKVIIEPSEFLLAVDAEVTVLYDVYLCLPVGGSCFFEKTSFDRLRAEKHTSVFVKHNFRPLVRCSKIQGELVQVEASIDNPEIKHLVLHRLLAQDTLKVSRGMITALSVPVLNGAEFKGFRTLVSTFNEGEVELEVSRANKEISIVTRFQDGSLRSSYITEGCVNLP